MNDSAFLILFIAFSCNTSTSNLSPFGPIIALSSIISVIISQKLAIVKIISNFALCNYKEI